MKVKFRIQNQEINVTFDEDNLVREAARDYNYLMTLITDSIGKLITSTASKERETIDVYKVLYSIAKDYKIPFGEIEERLKKARL